MIDQTNPQPAGLDRRHFLKTAGVLAASAMASPKTWAGEMVSLPFENGARELVTYPQKRPLLLLTARPPQLETPFSVFNEGVITPNDAFFVRYHLSDIPTRIDPSSYRVRIRGAVNTPRELSLADLEALGDPMDVVAVNQCSGNSRGFFSPRVPGGQLGHGAMGNAKWTGVPLKRVLEKAGVAAGARQVTFDGLDRGVVAATPDFVKALDIDHALDGEVMLAYAMNGADIPMLNGYPLRLVVPGYYGTYWVKHVSDITVVDSIYAGFWMNPAYRVPDNPSRSVNPGEAPKKTVPITRFSIRSFITSLADGVQVRAGRETAVRGIAFDGGQGIREVQFSSDGGRTWRGTTLGQDLGRYSFREWKTAFTPSAAGKFELMARAFNRAGESQPLEPLWNPAGYMRNVVEKVNITAA
ncbi:MAG: molybdopterin-dependent oxidoreductase [Opitutaceae bacterium]|nr:molybdopterin-dependent oxidoreductase [Opitutaceae bacterium]